jgi:L-methionine (R)-S-oxide reductase
MSETTQWSQILNEILESFSCQTGTIHRSADNANLNLIYQIGVPDFLIDKISLIPFGKGIAGFAAQTREPVELCNLQQDLGSIAKADARLTGVAGSLAVPIFSTDGQRVIGTLGIGKHETYSFTENEKSALADCAREIGKRFAQNPACDD